MSCTAQTLNGIALNCSSVGGLKKLEIIDVANLIVQKLPSGKVIYTTINGNTFKEFSFRKGNANFVSTQTGTDANGTKEVSTVITASFNKMETIKRAEMVELSKGNVFVIVTDNNNIKWFIGYDSYVTSNAVGESGSQNLDANKYTLTMTSITDELPMEVDTEHLNIDLTIYKPIDGMYVNENNTFTVINSTDEELWLFLNNYSTFSANITRVASKYSEVLLLVPNSSILTIQYTIYGNLDAHNMLVYLTVNDTQLNSIKNLNGTIGGNDNFNLKTVYFNGSFSDLELSENGIENFYSKYPQTSYQFSYNSLNAQSIVNIFSTAIDNGDNYGFIDISNGLNATFDNWAYLKYNGISPFYKNYNILQVKNILIDDRYWEVTYNG